MPKSIKRRLGMAFVVYSLFQRASHAFPTTFRRLAPRRTSSPAFLSNENDAHELKMENLYQEWSLQDDRRLWKHRHRPIAVQASLLGRGLRGVQARLKKLENTNHPAYQRLFCNGYQSNQNDEELEKCANNRLIPAGDVLRRIQFDHMLDDDKFSILYYDRIQDKLVESPIRAQNESISGKEAQLIDALPEHRIRAIKYRERIVWDREERLDIISGKANGVNIYEIMENYDEWKHEQEAAKEQRRVRQALVGQQLQRFLGLERFENLRSFYKELQISSQDATASTKQLVEIYVEKALVLCREARRNPSTDVLLLASNDWDTFDALDALSEMFSLLPDAELRQTVLEELALHMGQNRSNAQGSFNHPPRPSLNEEDLKESFVRGTGPGGQKINKTSNRVLLVHEPTGIRVECQETRSLQQNRKIARRRLQQKLEEHFLGRQSRTAVKAQKASAKKQKAKNRSRARLRKKQQDAKKKA